MKNKQKLILEYAKLAALHLQQGQKTVDARMKEIEGELMLTKEAIIKQATQIALASFK